MGKAKWIFGGVFVVGLALVGAYHLGLFLLPFDQAWPTDASAIRAADAAYWTARGTSVMHMGVAGDGPYAVAIYNGGFSDEVVVFKETDGGWERVKRVEPDACSIESAGVPKANAEALDYKINHMDFFVHHALHCSDSWYYGPS